MKGKWRHIKGRYTEMWHVFPLFGVVIAKDEIAIDLGLGPFWVSFYKMRKRDEVE